MAGQDQSPDAVAARSALRPALDRLPPELVEHMRSRLPCQDKETVMDVLGISSNTWLKLKRGEPIRSSVADRLKRHFDGHRAE